jgi:MFS family permease
MSNIIGVLRHERRARWFLLANAQSTIGTYAAVVALMVLAYERLHSPWAVSLVLLADFLPSMVLGPIFGAAADRWSRRGCAIAAEVLRAAAFVGVALVGSFPATVAFATLAGVGTALFSPAVLAALPNLAAPERSAAVTSLYGATRDLGRTLGPLVAAALFPVIGAEKLMLVNGATFAISAIVIGLVPLGRGAGPTVAGSGILREAREGLTATWRMPGVRVVLWASSLVIVFAAMVNVGELLLARDLGASASGFAILMVGVGVGVVTGSLLGSRGGELHEMKPRYLAGILLVGASLIGLAVAPNYGTALIAFFAQGLGNGVVIVHERLMFHAAVPENLMGRAFAVLDTLGGWGFAIAFVSAGAIITALSTRAMFAVAGTGALLVWLAASLSMRRVWQPTAVDRAV